LLNIVVRLEKCVKVGEPRAQKDWQSWIDQQILDAQDRGEFDDLPGKGRPLELASNPYAQDQEMAFKILKDSGHAPDWIELDKAIRGKLDRARAILIRRWRWCNDRMSELDGRAGNWAEAERGRVLGSWDKVVAEFEEEVAAINRETAELNLRIPGLRFQRSKIDAAVEIRRLTGRQCE
jgi:DnaJ family protein C protein 28